MTSKRESSGRSADRPPKVEIPERIAAQLMRRFLRDPFDARPEPRLEALSVEEQGALDKVLEAVGASQPDLVGSAVVRSRAIATLVDSLEAGPASPERAEGALNRLGSAGLLSPAEYRLEFGDSVGEFARYGDRQAHIEKTIRHPDLVQHLSATGDEVSSEAEGVSLFVERIFAPKGQTFTRVVVCGRRGKLLRFQASWRIYEKVLPHSREGAPLELLKHFVDRYGLEITLLGRMPTKFILYQAIPNPGPNMRFLGMQDPVGRDFSMQMLMRPSTAGVLEISMAYAIDTTAYSADVQALGQ